MAQKIATYDYKYSKCAKEAKRIVEEWYIKSKIAIDPKTIYIVWFAFTKSGYRCMVTSKLYRNNFFEISKNLYNNEMICHILQQVECIVHPSQSEAIYLQERTDESDSLI